MGVAYDHDSHPLILKHTMGIFLILLLLLGIVLLGIMIGFGNLLIATIVTTIIAFLIKFLLRKALNGNN